MVMMLGGLLIVFLGLTSARDWPVSKALASVRRLRLRLPVYLHVAPVQSLQDRTELEQLRPPGPPPSELSEAERVLAFQLLASIHEAVRTVYNRSFLLAGD